MRRSSRRAAVMLRSLGAQVTLFTAVPATVLALACPSIAVGDAELRGYEKVTPDNKGAGTVQAVDTFRSNADGSRFLMSVTGAFASVATDSMPVYTRYLATRDAEGWSLTGTDAPFSSLGHEPSLAFVMGTLVSSDDLSHVLVASTAALTPGAIEGGGNLYVRNTETRELTLVAASADPAFAKNFLRNQGNGDAWYVANDGRSAIFQSEALAHPDAPEGETVGYKWTLDGGVEIVTVLPDGTPIAGSVTTVESDSGVRGGIPRTRGADRVYFYSRSSAVGGGALYVREGTTTRLVSQSHIGEPSGEPVQARLLLTSPDTRYVVFETVENVSLTDDTPAGLTGSRVYYRYDAESGDLRFVGSSSPVLNGSVIGMSDDGQTFAFRSTDALAPSAVPGRINTYLWKGGVLRTAHVRDAGLPHGAALMLRELSPNGRYLVFTDESPSTAARFGLDNTGPTCGSGGTAGRCRQVYRFDSEAPDPATALECVSCRTDGQPPRGHAGTTNAFAGYIRMDRHQMRMALDDGRVLFTALDDLVPVDGNGLPDVYEYRDGVRTLLSRGTPGRPARLLDTSRDGSSVFFATDDQIASLDGDQAVDVYVLRKNALPERAADPIEAPCTGSDCRESTAPAPGPAMIGSNAFGGGGNVVPAPRRARVSVRVLKAKAVSRAAVVVRVRVPAAGRIVVAGRAVRRKRVSASKAGSYSVRIVLNRRAKRSLAKKRKLKVGVRVSYLARDGRSASRRVAVTVKQFNAKRSKAKKGGR